MYGLLRQTPLLALALAVAAAPALAQEDAGSLPPLADPPAATPDAGLALSPEDQALLRELEAAAAPATAPAPGLPRGSLPVSNLFNPALSLNGLLLGTATSGPGDTARAGLDIQELELQLTANVDPYLSANATFSVPQLSTFEVEEAYLSALPQPFGLSLRAGKIRTPFGRENAFHTHALPFVDRSLVSTAVFGDEGLSEVGVEGSWLAPLPWYALLTVAGIDGRNEALFNSPVGRDLAGVAALRTVFDLTDDATLEAGASYALGNNADRQLAQALGAHLVFRWRPARDATSRSLTATVEGLAARPTGAPLTGGLYAALQWQLARRWYVGGRFEVLAQQADDTEMTMKQSAILVFVPTEFSALRLQGSVREPPAAGPIVVEAFLQANFTIGSHPAHAY